MPVLPDSLDQETISRVLRGDRDAFGILVARYNQQLFRAARAIVQQSEPCRDILQQSYLNAFRNLRQFKGHSSFSTWITRIVIREALHFVGRREDLPLRNDDKPEITVAGFATPSDLVERRQIAAAIESAIDKLPEAFRCVFVLREVQGLSIPEIAEILSESEPLIRVRLFRAKGYLKKLLSADLSMAEADAFLFLGHECSALHGRVLRDIRALENIFTSL